MPLPLSSLRCGASRSKMVLGTYPVIWITLGLADHAGATVWALFPAAGSGATPRQAEDGHLIGLAHSLARC